MAIPPTVIVIFGGAGDLTWRKLIPSLFDLRGDGRMPDRFAIIAVDRIPMQNQALRRQLRDGVQQFSRTAATVGGGTRGKKRKPRLRGWERFAQQISYHQGDFTELSTYTGIASAYAALKRRWHGSTSIIFHMATPPEMFAIIPGMLARSGLAQDRDGSRIVVEKPIGHDLESARELNVTLTKSFHESQIFRIDHYLGKETVQNILAFRFANPLFEPIWNRRYVDHVTITVAETVGVGHRGGYYDHTGALRDMIQNHLMQLMCLVAMEPVVSLAADDIRDKKLEVLQAVRRIPARSVKRQAVRGQYTAGSIDGTRVRGYRQEDRVSRRSTTETFAAVKLFIDNWRWEGVPFYLVTGKCLASQVSTITIQFRDVPHNLFPHQARRDWTASRLVMSIQPEEAITLGFQAKYPGPEMRLRPVEMHFNYRDSFGAPSPDAYETLLWDVMRNDQLLFMRSDQVEAAWSIVMPIVTAWATSSQRTVPTYAAGSWGPQQSTQLLGGSLGAQRPLT